MDISVGAEYVIASALIALRNHGKDCISFDTLRDLGWNIQQRCNEAGVDAIILTSGTDIKVQLQHLKMPSFLYCVSVAPDT